MAALDSESTQKHFHRKWNTGIELLFKESFLNQLRETTQGDMKKEVKQSLDHLLNDKTGAMLLRDDGDLAEKALLLGISDKEMSTVKTIPDKRQQPHELAKLYVMQFFRSIATGKNIKSTTGDTTRKEENGPTGHKRSNSNTVVKQVGAPQQEPMSAHDMGEESRQMPGRAFNLNSDADLRNLRQYPSPRLAFYKTSMFESIKTRVIESDIQILHIYGMSGSGKSQIVLGVCKEVDLLCPRYLIWHIQCQPTGGVIIRELQRFVQKLNAGNPQIVSNEDMHAICHDLEERQMASFVRAINAVEFPVLLVVEDVQDAHEKAIIRSVITEILSSLVKNVQLLIVTQKLDALYVLGDIEAIRELATKKVTGFAEKEAIDFLKNGEHEERMIAELASELAYSPLRLFLAKTYCTKFGISYEAYYKSLGKDPDVIRKEKEILEKHPELGKHTYEVIMKILEPKDPANKDEVNEFEVIKMMSFLNNGTIPDILLGAFLREIREFTTVEEERRQVKYLLQRLEEECDVNIMSPIGEAEEYGRQNVTIHNDILSAVRLSIDITEKRQLVIKVLRAVISLVRKENRFRTDNILLFDMMNHMKPVADFAAELIEIDFKPDKPKKEDFEIQICLSRLYEVLGFAVTQTSGNTKDENFAKAVDYLWSIACYYTGKPILNFIPVLKKDVMLTDKLQSQLHYEEGKDPVETAKKAYKRLSKASAELPLDSVTRNCDRFFPITTNLLKDMKTKLDGKRINWEEMENELNDKRQLTEKQLKILRENRALLSRKELRSVYLTECIASILHSRGRQVLYLKNTISHEEQRRYEWYTELGLELCKCLSKQTRIKSIFEYIIQANNKLPRMLHPRTNETNADFWSRIEKSRKIASELRDVRGDFYEHGVYKLVSGTPYTVMNALKYRVKANTKVYKRPDVAEQHAVPTETIEAQQLLQMAKENASKFVVASNCMIHVGKYYAAIKEYNKALEAFEDGFDHNGHGINSTIDKNVNGYAWALYNHGRALYASRCDIENFRYYAERFFQRYENLQIPRQWKEDLDEIKMKLETLITGTKNSACSSSLAISPS